MMKFPIFIKTLRSMKTITKFCALLLTCEMFDPKAFAQTSSSPVYFIPSLNNVCTALLLKLYLNNERFVKLPDNNYVTNYL